MTACTSTECPMREKCYRASSKANQFEVSFNYEYGCNEYSGFRDFISAKSYSKK